MGSSPANYAIRRIVDSRRVLSPQVAPVSFIYPRNPCRPLHKTTWQLFLQEICTKCVLFVKQNPSLWGAIPQNTSALSNNVRTSETKWRVPPQSFAGLGVLCCDWLMLRHALCLVPPTLHICGESTRRPMMLFLPCMG